MPVVRRHRACFSKFELEYSCSLVWSASTEVENGKAMEMLEAVHMG